MPWANPRKLIEDARKGGYAVGAFNMHNDETTEALVMAAEQAKSPVFLQVGRAIVPHMGVRRAFEMTKRTAENSNAQFVIHLDHGPWDECIEAIKLGFNSIMCDFAHLPFEDNIAKTKRIVEIKLPRPRSSEIVGSDAFGSPITAQLTTPPFSTILGLAPKNAGSHSTRSAILPTSTDPTTPAMPCVIAGLIVILAT